MLPYGAAQSLMIFKTGEKFVIRPLTESADSWYFLARKPHPSLWLLANRSLELVASFQKAVNFSTVSTWIAAFSAVVAFLLARTEFRNCSCSSSELRTVLLSDHNLLETKIMYSASYPPVFFGKRCDAISCLGRHFQALIEQRFNNERFTKRFQNGGYPMF